MRGTSRTNTDSTAVLQPALVPAVVESNKCTELRATQNTQSTVLARDNEAAQAYNNENGGILLIGKCLTSVEYLNKLQTSSCSRGDRHLQSNMGLISKDGCSFVIRNKFINLTHL